MIRTVDKKTERYLFDTHSESLVPFEVTVRDDDITVEVFKRVKRVGKEFYKLFKNNPFSVEAIDFIHSSLKDRVEEWGYFTDDIMEGHIVTYIAKSWQESIILDSTVAIYSADGSENLTGYELEPLDPNENEVYFVTVIDGNIVSVCETNSSDAFIGAKEINVYTSPEYRGRGYGASNVSAMIKHYLTMGERVAYTSRKDNIPSCKTAEKCGLERIAETFYYICYAKEE